MTLERLVFVLFLVPTSVCFLPGRNIVITAILDHGVIGDAQLKELVIHIHSLISTIPGLEQSASEMQPSHLNPTWSCFAINVPFIYPQI